MPLDPLRIQVAGSPQRDHSLRLSAESEVRARFFARQGGLLLSVFGRAGQSLAPLNRRAIVGFAQEQVDQTLACRQATGLQQQSLLEISAGRLHLLQSEAS
jgi:hypothetical protein